MATRGARHERCPQLSRRNVDRASFFLWQHRESRSRQTPRACRPMSGRTQATRMGKRGVIRQEPTRNGTTDANITIDANDTAKDHGAMLTSGTNQVATNDSKEITICLCMIVKHEAKIIERCLASVRGLIDHWVICDTGSTDDTVERIERTLEGIPGQVHRRPWVNFGVNRTEAIERARHKADYLLVIDADMTVSFDDGAKRALTADSYMLRYTGDLDYRQRLLVSGRRAYRYIGVTHEYIETEPDERTEILDKITVKHHHDGNGRATKSERDLQLLTQALKVDPTNARTVFYLAQTYRDLDRIDEALETYEMRATMGGWEEEVFYAIYQAAVLVDRRGHDWGTAFQAFVRAWEYRPSRLEPIYHIVNRLRRRKEFHTALLFAGPALLQPYPSNDILFVHRWMYTYGLAFEYMLCCAEIGRHSDVIATADLILACKDAPEAVVAETKRRRDDVQRLRHTQG
jgi:glycosyltransferase involved in cell wall biosynthesis